MLCPRPAEALLVHALVDSVLDKRPNLLPLFDLRCLASYSVTSIPRRNAVGLTAKPAATRQARSRCSCLPRA